MGDEPKRARVWIDSVSGSVPCRSCHAPIIWAELCKSGRRMCLDKLEVLNQGIDDESGRAYQTISLHHTHWATCPQAKQWKGGQRGSKTAAMSE